MTRQAHHATAGLEESRNHIEQGAFATAGMADDTNKFTLSNLQIDITQGFKGTAAGGVDLAHPAELEKGRVGGGGGGAHGGGGSSAGQQGPCAEAGQGNLGDWRFRGSGEGLQVVEGIVLVEGDVISEAEGVTIGTEAGEAGSG